MSVRLIWFEDLFRARMSIRGCSFGDSVKIISGVLGGDLIEYKDGGLDAGFLRST